MNGIPRVSLGQMTGLPMPIKIVAGVLGGASLMGLAYMLFNGNTTAMLIIVIGLVIVGCLLAFYKAILGWVRKRRANPLSQGLAGNAAAAPQGISEPARRARLDDLRRNFDQGVEKFRAAGKNLYSVPWYVLVGEPGSGKTEAIRHCNVGFPPGLQDQLQGAGGTLNMNWWFTNQAIILDTAGRLMFEEVAPGSTNEWAEFLKLLKNNRPNSPLNGILLVIPVDTLIKDSADQIEKKASKIAQQFDQIQRTLGVRFPVFIIISKCDLLNGFREFFDDLNDPQLQHQIMGWSNPANLDERFDPAAVTTHLETVKVRLNDRRQHLILDPVNTEDPQARRVDQVDALYAMPDSIAKIGPRLRRYLEMVFVAGEWSPKPLFLRGIYFTSSMTEGSALDAELAEVLGVPVDSLPEGRVWRRDRAYFLRDLFIEKVFREKGLVTRASNADKQQRTRRTIVLTTGFVAVVLLFVLAWLGSRQLEASIGKHRDFWMDASSYDPKEMQIINQKASNKYYADANIGKEKADVAQFFGNNLPLVQSDIHIPLIFKPMTLFSTNINTERRTAYRALFENTVLAPAYDAARKKIPALADAWTPQATAALAQLMKLEYAKATTHLPDDKHPQVELDPLFAVALSEDDYKKFTADADGLQQVADWIYTKDANGDKAWPPALLAPGSDTSISAVNQGVKAVLDYWDRQTRDDSAALKTISDVSRALSDFKAAEKDLQDKQALIGTIGKLSDYDAFHAEWTTQMAKLGKARDSASNAWLAASKSKGDNASLADLYSTQKTRVIADAQTAYDTLLKYTPAADSTTPGSNASFGILLDARSKLQAAQKNLKDWKSDPAAAATLKLLTELDAAYLASVKGMDNAPHHRFEVQGDLYNMADKLFVAKGGVTLPPTASLDEAFSTTDKDYSAAAESAKRLQIQANGPDDSLSKAISLTQYAIDASARAKKYLYADGLLTSLPADPRAWPAAMKTLAAAAPRDTLARPPVPLVTFPAGQDKIFDEQFSPDAAGIVSDRLALIAKTTSGPDAPAKILDADNLSSRTSDARKGFDAYRDKYIAYWRDTVKDQLTFNYPKFADLATKFNDTSEASISEQLKAYGDRMVYALNRVGAADDANAVKLAPQVSREECKQALTSWTNLGSDPKQVRSAILATEANTFRENYTVLSAKANDSYTARYWQNLPVQALHWLALDGQAEINAGKAALANFEHFPSLPQAIPRPI